MRKQEMGELKRVIGFGVLAGIRSLSTPAFLSHRSAVGPVMKILAVGEAIADKTGRVPARTQPVSLGGRIVSGGLAGAVLSAATGRLRPGWILAGAGAAVATAYAAYHFRHWLTERTRAPDALIGVAEDILVFSSGRRLVGLI